MALASTDEQASPVALPRRGITRRQALAAALATGVGVGAVRLLGGSMQQLATPLAGSATGWISPLKSESARVMHFLRRTAFGYSPTQLEIALSDGFDKTVDRLIESKPADPPPLEAATTPGERFPIAQVQQWWINHMLTTQTPFAERMTLFWHGHFTSDYRKAADNTFMYWQNLTWRRMAMTDLPAMLVAVTTDPAMLRYLDLATSTGQNPNENYSRELMELFTMGPGNFTEQDVREGAKALAGWQLPKPDAIATVTVNNNVMRRLPVFSTQQSGVFTARRAYKGGITYLGHQGRMDTACVIDRILAQASTAGRPTRRGSPATPWSSASTSWPRRSRRPKACCPRRMTRCTVTSTECSASRPRASSTRPRTTARAGSSPLPRRNFNLSRCTQR